MTATTFPPEAAERLRAYLASRHIPSGLGTEEEACSIAAINLVLTGELTDRIPECMSLVTGRWIRRVQDPMPDEIRNSPEWKALLPLAAGTGREHEEERRAIVLDWMWGTVLPTVQPVADRYGFGMEWRVMCEERTAVAARSVADDASAAACAAAAAADDAAAADAAADAAAAAHAAEVTAYARGEAWRTFDPVGVLRRLVEVGAS
jgi:hypothetical protein